jgi:hypothetical protein
LAFGHAQPENNAMKTIQTFVFAAALGAAVFTRAAEPSTVAPEKPDPKTAGNANTASAAASTGAADQPAPIHRPESGSQHRQAPDKSAQLLPPPEATAANGQIAESVTPATAANGNGTNTLRMNFHGASLDLVLNYFSEAAGFVINIKPGTTVKGKVDLWNNEPLTREEAVNLLDTVLYQNGLAAIRTGKTLTIVNRDEAKTQNIPVIQGSDPDKMVVSDKIVTQIIPVRFVEVKDLIKDLQPLVDSVKTTMTANEAGNAIVITDTQANIRKVAEIIRAIDMGAEEFTEVRVFHLTNSDPTVISAMLSDLFPDDSKGGNNQSQLTSNPFFSRFASRFGGFGGGGPGGPGGGPGTGTSGSGNQNQRIKKRNRVIAVAEERTASVVVSATRDLMEQIADVVTELDTNPKGRRVVKVYRLENADPQEALPVLTDIFSKNTTQNNRNSANQNNNALLSRSATQNNQNNSGSRTSSMIPNSRGGSSAPSFP